MSLGGFAQGLATAFQRAEDRYQDKKAREEARAEARLARAANQAFQEKMYTRRQKDDYMKEVMSYQAELKAIFGTDKKGLQMVAAVMPMGKYGVEMAKNYQSVANERGFNKAEFQNMFEIMYPDGVDSETFGDVNLENIVAGMEKNRFAKEGDPRDPLSGIGFKFKPLPQKLQDFTELVGPDEESTVQMAKAHIQNLKNRKVTGERLIQAEAFLKSSQADLDKKIADALNLAKAKSGEKLQQTKAALEDNLVDTFKNYTTSAVDPVFTMETSDRIELSLKGNLSPKLMGDLRRAEQSGLKKIASIKDDDTYGNLTYRAIATDTHNTFIIEPQLKVYRALKDKAEEQYQQVVSPTSGKSSSKSKSDFQKLMKGQSIAESNIVIIKHRKEDPDTGEITYGGKSVDEYRRELSMTLKENHFYVIPKYNSDGSIDFSKKPAFNMHKTLFSKTSAQNPLGLGVYLEPKKLNLPTQ